jgi:hypothetical protein
MPRNAFDARAGLDVSHAVRHYLGMSHNELTYWRFADKADVPEDLGRKSLRPRATIYRRSLRAAAYTDCPSLRRVA